MSTSELLQGFLLTLVQLGLQTETLTERELLCCEMIDIPDKHPYRMLYDEPRELLCVPSFFGNLGDHRVSPQFCFIWKAGTGYRTLTPTLPSRDEGRPPTRSR